MLFSILVPIYNMEKYLPECLCSITKQDYSDYEIILVDDGSTDDSGKICDDFSSENGDMCKVVHKPNGGLMSARRKSFELARGEYCICLDADDLLADGALTHLAELNISYNNWSMAAKCIKTSFAQTKFDFKPYYNISYGEDTIQSAVLYNEAESFVYTSRRIYNYRVKSGMTGNANIRCLKDFYQVSRFIKKECGDWSDDIEHSSDQYFALTAVDYIRIAVYSDRGFRSFRRSMLELVGDEEIMAVLDKVSGRSDDSELESMYRRLKAEKFFSIYAGIFEQRIREAVKARIK